MVSICIATYNGERYIKEQLGSILSQISIDDEIIISDDGSIDDTIKEIESFSDPRITIHINQGRKGFSGNFENALRLAKGDYIFLSDQDDVWLPQKYKESLRLLNDFDLIVTNSIVTNENLDTLYPSFFKIYNSGKGIFKNIIKSTYYGSCMAFRRRILDLAIPFPASNEIGHDLWLGLVSEIKGSVYFCDTPLLLYRRHKNAFCEINEGKTKSSRPLYKKIAGRIIILWELAKFYTKNIFK